MASGRSPSDILKLLIAASVVCIGFGYCVNRSIKSDAKDKMDRATYEPQRLKEESALLRFLNAKGKTRAWKYETFELAYDNKKIVVTILYKIMPSQRTAAYETKAMAQNILDFLAKNGRKPQKEDLSVSVTAQQNSTGTSGAPIVRVFGYTRYVSFRDSLEWSPASDWLP